MINGCGSGSSLLPGRETGFRRQKSGIIFGNTMLRMMQCPLERKMAGHSCQESIV